MLAKISASLAILEFVSCPIAIGVSVFNSILKNAGTMLNNMIKEMKTRLKLPKARAMFIIQLITFDKINILLNAFEEGFN